MTLETEPSQALIGHVNEARKDLRNLAAKIKERVAETSCFAHDPTASDGIVRGVEEAADGPPYHSLRLQLGALPVEI